MAYTATGVPYVQPTDAVSAYPNTSLELAEFIQELAQLIVPVGTIQPYAGQQSSLSANWLICDGRPISRGTYPDLFAAIGTVYGAGDGTNTFNLPNYGGRTLIGADASYALGAAGGSTTHTLSANEMPVHSHGMDSAGHHGHSGWTDVQGHHAHGANTAHPYVGGSPGHPNNFTGIYYVGGMSAIYQVQPVHVHGAGEHSHNVGTHGAGDHTHAVHNAGGGAAHNIMQPYVAVNYIILATHA